MPTAIISHEDPREQTVHLPKNAAFPKHINEVEVIIVGNTRILTPPGERWRLWASRPSQLTDDCFSERGQPDAQVREGLER